MYLRVVTWLLKDCNSEIVEVTDMNDWLDIKNMCLRVVTCFMKDFHGNDLHVTDVNNWLGFKDVPEGRNTVTGGLP